MHTDEALIAAELLEILRCPKCHGELTVEPQALGCGACALAFSVRDGVPNFLLEDARRLGAPKGGA